TRTLGQIEFENFRHGESRTLLLGPVPRHPSFSLNRPPAPARLSHDSADTPSSYSTFRLRTSHNRLCPPRSSHTASASPSVSLCPCPCMSRTRPRVHPPPTRPRPRTPCTPALRAPSRIHVLNT